jgi:predicted transcriptional regulator
VEILRDFLDAIQESGKKTRIIGLANLNPASFRPYLRFCLEHELIEETSGEFRLTPRAHGVLRAIQRLIAGSAEVDAALLELHRGLDSTLSRPPATQALRFVSLLTWNDVLRSASRSLAVKTEPIESGLSVDLPATRLPSWLDGYVLPDLDGPAISSPLPPAATTLARRRPPRIRPI